MTTHMTGLSGNIRPPKNAPGTKKPRSIYVYPCDCFVKYELDKRGRCSMCGGERREVKK